MNAGMSDIDTKRAFPNPPLKAGIKRFPLLLICSSSSDHDIAARPNGIPQPNHFEIVAAELPEIADNQVVVRNEYLSVEPAIGLGVYCGMFRRWWDMSALPRKVDTLRPMWKRSGN